MAKSQLNYIRTITDKFSVKGVLSEDGKTLTYVDENKIEQKITITECLRDFRGYDIEFVVSVKQSEDMILPCEDDEE